MRVYGKRKLLRVRMDYFQRKSAAFSRLERVLSDEIKRSIERSNVIVDRIKTKVLKWFGHLFRMPGSKWSIRVLLFDTARKKKEKETFPQILEGKNSERYAGKERC